MVWYKMRDGGGPPLKRKDEESEARELGPEINGLETKGEKGCSHLRTEEFTLEKAAGMARLGATGEDSRIGKADQGEIRGERRVTTLLLLSEREGEVFSEKNNIDQRIARKGRGHVAGGGELMKGENPDWTLADHNDFG